LTPWQARAVTGPSTCSHISQPLIVVSLSMDDVHNVADRRLQLSLASLAVQRHNSATSTMLAERLTPPSQLIEHITELDAGGSKLFIKSPNSWYARMDRWSIRNQTSKLTSMFCVNVQSRRRFTDTDIRIAFC